MNNVTLKLFCLSVALSFSTLSQSQCEIWDMRFDLNECIDGEFSIFINFNHQNTSDSFDLRGNGNHYGRFAYTDLPVLLGPLQGDCTTPYEFVAIDKDDDDCRDFVAVGEVCCEECDIFDLVVEVNDCEGELFSVTIDFEHDATGDAFEIRGNGHLYGTWEYGQLPVTIDGLVGDCTTEYEFVIQDLTHPDCRAEYVVGEVCCIEECRIFDLTFEVLRCRGDSCIDIRIDFLHEGTSGVGFDVYDRSGHIGFYSYGHLPLVIECYPISGLDFEYIRVCDNDNPDCCAEAEEEAIVCDTACSIRDLVVEAFDCDSSSSFYVEVDFIHDNTSDSGFVLKVGGVPLHTYSYDSLPISAGPFAGGCDTIYEFVVCDVVDSTCADTTHLERPCCEGECEIGRLHLERTTCDSNDMFYVVLTFDYARTSDSFYLEHNGIVLGKYAYNNLPLTFGPFEGDCETEHGFLVRDESGECAEDASLGVVCCEESCEIYDLVAEIIECNGDSCIRLVIDFEHTGTSGVGFDLYDRHNHIGFYSYDSLPLTIDCYPISGLDFEFIRVCDNDHPDCCASIEIEAIECDMSCHIRDFDIEVIECDSNQNFYIRFDFIHENTSDTGFALKVDGVYFDQYGYDELPIVAGPFEGGCDEDYVFQVCDLLHPDCEATVEVVEPCCEMEGCEIGRLMLEHTECDSNDMFYVILTFDHARTSDSFLLEHMGMVIGKYAYSSLPLTFGPFEGDCETEYGFLVRDESGECAEDGSLGVICCGEPCEINDLVVELLECQGDSCVSLVLDFEHEGTSTLGFDVYDRHNHIGFFSYDSLPLTIDCFPISGLDFEFIRVCDNDRPNCCASVEVRALNCDTSCVIREFDLEVIECDSNQNFYVRFDFIHHNESDTGFALKVGGVFFDQYGYDELPVVAGPFEGGCDEVVVFQVCDLLDPHCEATVEVEDPCCEEAECELGRLELERTECDSNGLFYVRLDFDHAHTSDSFEVYLTQHIQLVGVFAYADLPVTFGPFEGDCETEYGFLVRDITRDCAEDASLGIVCCEEMCHIYDLTFEIIECNGDSCIVIELDFEHDGTSGVGFDVYDRMGHIGFYSYDSLPLIIDCYPISGFEEEFIAVCDNDNPNCCAEAEVEAIDCTTGTSDLNDAGWDAWHALTSSELYLNANLDAEPLQVTMYDMAGNKVLSRRFDQTDVINLSSMISGVYVVHLSTEFQQGYLKVVIP